MEGGADLILSEQRVADAGGQHHGHQEGHHCLGWYVARHIGGALADGIWPGYIRNPMRSMREAMAGCAEDG